MTIPTSLPPIYIPNQPNPEQTIVRDWPKGSFGD